MVYLVCSCLDQALVVFQPPFTRVTGNPRVPDPDLLANPDTESEKVRSDLSLITCTSKIIYKLNFFVAFIAKGLISKNY